MPKEPLILAIETAKRKWSVSLLEGSREISFRVGGDLISSSEMLVQTIYSLLKESGVTLKDLSAIAVSKGPGSFTGIRVGLATAQALAFGAEIKCYGISLLEAMLLMSKDNTGEKHFTAVIAGQNQVYWQAFSFFKNQFVSDSDPCFDDWDIFLADLEKVANQEGILKVIVSTEKELNLIEKSERQLSKQIEFQIASDNASKYIGLMFREVMVTGSQPKENRSDSENLTPLYVSRVRIGNSVTGF